MKSSAVALSIAVLAACADSQRLTPTQPVQSTTLEQTVPADSNRFISVWEIGPDGKGIARPARVSELDEETRRRVEAIGFDPERWPEPMKRWRASVLRGSPAFAVTAGDLPDGAVALVIRDPSAAEDRLIVVSEASLDDEVIALATHALRQDEIATPDATSRRVLTLFADRRVRIETDERTAWHSFRFEFLSSDRRKHSERLLASAAGGPERHVAGIGRVRIAPARPHRGRQP